MAYIKTTWVDDETVVNATRMNNIETGIENLQNVPLLAVSDTAPSECEEGDKYFNTTSKKIFTATGHNTWGSTGEDPLEGILYIVFSTKTTYSLENGDLISVGGGGAEIAISTTEPTEEEILWINPEDTPSGSLNPITNTYSEATDKGYSCNYLNGKFANMGKTLWTGSFTSGSINVPNLDKYRIIGVVAGSVFCIGNKAFGGGIYGTYGGTNYGVVSYRLASSGDTLNINSYDKGAYDNGTQVAITEIIGIF